MIGAGVRAPDVSDLVILSAAKNLSELAGATRDSSEYLGMTNGAL